MRKMLVLVLAVLIFGSPGRAKDERADVLVQLNQTALPAGGRGLLAVALDVKRGFHAQSHAPLRKGDFALNVTMAPAAGVRFGEPIYPAGKDENYMMVGTLNVYTGRVIVYVPIEATAEATAGPVTLTGKIHYQICDNRGTCFFPQHEPFAVETAIVPAGQAVGTNAAELFQGVDAATIAGATTAPAANAGVGPTSSGDVQIEIFGYPLSLGHDARVLAFGVAFLVGLLFNLMPCVLPVVPLKAIGFYEVSRHNRAKSVALGGVFSLGLIASFGVLALLVVVLQVFRWGELFSNAWFLGALVIVLLVMALSMFGAFAVNVPTAVYRLAPRHDTYSGNFLFGVLTAALSTPCTFGMFFGVLAWALAQPMVVGVALLMMVGVGMAFPYFLLSAFPELARRIPRTGPWAQTIKQLMGFLLLGTAVYFAGPFIGRVLGPLAYWWCVFAVIVAAGVFLVVRTMRYSPGLWPRLAAATVALAMILPAFYVVRLLTAKPYTWQPYTREALAAARARGKIVLVDFTADWCGNCHALEAFVLNRPSVVKTVDDYDVVMLKADVTGEGAPGRPLLNQLNPVGAIPLTAIYSPSKQDPIQLTGIYKTTELREAIERAAGK